jgi:hypothetical protein
MKHTIMTENDVIHFCTQKFFINRSTAIAIAGQPGAPQHGLLATAPVIATTPPANSNSFLYQTITNPRRAASIVLGFDVDQLLDSAEQSESSNLPPLPPPAPYEWTGCMADIYNPAEGTFDFEALGNNYGTPLFDTGDISDPKSFDAIFSEVILQSRRVKTRTAWVASEGVIGSSQASHRNLPQPTTSSTASCHSCIRQASVYSFPRVKAASSV